jgi:hypothetical protein
MIKKFFNSKVKHYDTGDGMFFQLVVAISIWTTGLIVQVAKGFPQFYGYFFFILIFSDFEVIYHIFQLICIFIALPLLGGFFWTTVNKKLNN